nr:phage major tail protein 2 [uncultured Mediterranean phage uvMED]
MAIHKGSEGTVHVGTDAVAEIRSYSVEETADTLETTSMGDTARTHLASLLSFSGSLDVYWDETDTAQIALTAGTSVTIKFYPEGTASSAKYYTGTAIVTGVSRSASFDGLVEASISVQGTGALTPATA